MTIGDAIQYYRKKRKITQKQLAETIGCSMNSISRYENGKREPCGKTVQEIAHALSVSVAALYVDAQDGCEKKESTNDTQDKLDIKIEIHGYTPDLFIEKLDKYLSTLLRKDT